MVRPVLFLIPKNPPEPLPPLEERIGPEGSRHRVYPAPSPIDPPLNVEEGWPEDTPSPAPIVHMSLLHDAISEGRRSDDDNSPGDKTPIMEHPEDSTVPPAPLPAAESDKNANANGITSSRAYVDFEPHK